ncbi:hypothetical protein [Acinetobacter baumannii]
MKRFSDFYAELMSNADVAKKPVRYQVTTVTTVAIGVISQREYNERQVNIIDCGSRVTNQTISDRDAACVILDSSPASERLVRGIARGVIRDHKAELERLAYK